jgi:hypothetical protein
MNKIIELISRYLLIPLITEGFHFIVKWVRDYLEEKKLKKENKKKVEAYENSDNPNDDADSFGDLP